MIMTEGDSQGREVVIKEQIKDHNAVGFWPTYFYASRRVLTMIHQKMVEYAHTARNFFGRIKVPGIYVLPPYLWNIL